MSLVKPTPCSPPESPPESVVPVVSLAAAPARRSVEVVALLGEDALAQQLAAAGVWVGAVMELIGKAPFGDPLLFRLHGYRLALRRSEADRVRVRIGREAR